MWAESWGLVSTSCQNSKAALGRCQAWAKGEGIDFPAGPAWGTSGSLESLLACLDALRERFKNAVADLIGGSAAKALARLVRRLLGCHEADASRERYGGAYGRDDDYRRWGDSEDDEDYLDVPRPSASRQPTLLVGIAAGLLALLSWLAPLASWAGALMG